MHVFVSSRQGLASEVTTGLLLCSVLTCLPLRAFTCLCLCR